MNKKQERINYINMILEKLEDKNISCKDIYEMSRNQVLFKGKFLIYEEGKTTKEIYKTALEFRKRVIQNNIKLYDVFEQSHIKNYNKLLNFQNGKSFRNNKHLATNIFQALDNVYGNNIQDKKQIIKNIINIIHKNKMSCKEICEYAKNNLIYLAYDPEISSLSKYEKALLMRIAEIDKNLSYSIKKNITNGIIPIEEYTNYEIGIGISETVYNKLLNRINNIKSNKTLTNKQIKINFLNNLLNDMRTNTGLLPIDILTAFKFNTVIKNDFIETKYQSSLQKYEISILLRLLILKRNLSVKQLSEEIKIDEKTIEKLLIGNIKSEKEIQKITERINTNSNNKIKLICPTEKEIKINFLISLIKMINMQKFINCKILQNNFNGSLLFDSELMLMKNSNLETYKDIFKIRINMLEFSISELDISNKSGLTNININQFLNGFIIDNKKQKLIFNSVEEIIKEK